MLRRSVLVGLLVALPLSTGMAGAVGAARAAGGVRSFVLTATQEIWLDNGYPGLRMDTTPVRIQTSVWYAAPTRWRIERHYLTPPPQPALVGVFRPEPSVSVRDGRTWWTYDAVHHTASRQTAPDVQDVYPSGPPLWFESGMLGAPIPMRAARSIGVVLKAVAACDTAGIVPISTPQLVGRGTVAGRPADVIDFGPRPCGWNSASAPEIMGRRLMWVDRRPFFVLKVVRYSVFSRLVRPRDRYFDRTTVTGLRYNVPLPASRFAFTPPPGTRLVSAAASPTMPTPTHAAPLATIRRQVSFPLFLPRWLPGGLRLQQSTVDGEQHVTIDYAAPHEHVTILEGPLGCCLDADPRKYDAPTALPHGRTAYLLDVGAQYGGLIVWWDQAGTYIALSGTNLTTGTLLRIAASL